MYKIRNKPVCQYFRVTKLLQNHISVKDTFTEQDRLMDFHVTKPEKFIDMASALHLNFKKL